MPLKTDNVGLIKLTTNGCANGTTVEVDGTRMILKRATVIIDPKTGYNEIKVHGISEQREVSTFYGISEENFEFMKGLMYHLKDISDESLEHATFKYEQGSDEIDASLFELLNYVREQRKPRP